MRSVSNKQHRREVFGLDSSYCTVTLSDCDDLPTMDSSVLFGHDILYLFPNLDPDLYGTGRGLQMPRSEDEGEKHQTAHVVSSTSPPT